MALQIIKQRRLWWVISGLVIAAGLMAMIISWVQIGAPLRPSLDFVGGTRIQMELDCSKPNNCDRPLEVAEIRAVAEKQGLGDSVIQVLKRQGLSGQDQLGISLRTKTLNEQQRSTLKAELNKVRAFDPARTQDDTVGPTIGQQLLSSGLLAVVISFFGIAIYLSFRFQRDFAFFAVVATAHDVLITTGIFSILGLVLGTEVDSLFIVALLTIIGFSVNDTVVIYDRIRETIQLNPTKHINDVVDDSVNQTLGRSINTTMTTLLTLTAIFLFGGETLKNFALALIIGFVAGAYSSIFIASTLLALWRVKQGKAFVASDEPPQDDSEVVSSKA
jgi:preprotein translocase subunit SecF